MAFFATLTLALILISPFIGAACAIVWAIGALVKGDVVSSGRFSRRRTIYRSTNPIQFWTELGLYGVAIALLLALGLMFSTMRHGSFTNWFAISSGADAKGDECFTELKRLVPTTQYRRMSSLVNRARQDSHATAASPSTAEAPTRQAVIY
jgi:hypothetical protein